MTSTSEYLQALLAMFVIVNPLGAIPAYLGLTTRLGPRERQVTARVAALSVGCLLVTAVLAGETILHFVGIGVDHFKIGGGILLLLTATAMMNAEPVKMRVNSEELGDAETQEQIGAVPLGTPLLAGPGAISTAIIQSNAAGTASAKLWLIAVCLLVALATWAALQAAEPIRRVLGRTGINIATRIEGLLLAALAVRFIIEGLRTLLPGLAH